MRERREETGELQKIECAILGNFKAWEYRRNVNLKVLQLTWDVQYGDLGGFGIHGQGKLVLRSYVCWPLLTLLV